ncbi:MAG: hypothetical protein GY924_14150 [Planctomycetaceae bacterium]|nr:hypothetical protein [Planctomycetaceae bacterium]
MFYIRPQKIGTISIKPKLESTIDRNVSFQVNSSYTLCHESLSEQLRPNRNLIGSEHQNISITGRPGTSIDGRIRFIFKLNKNLEFNGREAGSQ